MPAKQGQATTGLARGLQAHAKDETDYGQDFAKLPGGISGGIAQLVKAQLGKYKTGPNAGKDYLLLSASVVSPKTAVRTEKIWQNGAVKIVSKVEENIEGRYTTKTMPLCDTTRASKTSPGETVGKTEDENIADALNEIRKIGGEECTHGITNEDDLNALLATLVSEGPFIKFGTSQPDPTAQYPESKTVWENWYGSKGLENYTVDSDTANPSKPAAQTQTASPPAQPPTTSAAPPAFNEFGDDPDALASLADAAPTGTWTDEMEKLSTMALRAGIAQSAIDNSDNWAALAELIKSTNSTNGGMPVKESEPENTTEPPPVQDDEKPEPAKGEEWKTKIKGPKDKRARWVVVEILSSSKKNRTATVKNMETKKPVVGDDGKPTNVSWDDLEIADE